VAQPDPTDMELTDSTSTAPVRVALATCREFAALDADDGRLPGVFARHGVVATPAVWDDPAVDWARFDLVLLRSTWDYPGKVAAFLAWIDGLPRVMNPAPVVRWNVDKRYLKDLADAGLPVVPTSFVGPGDPIIPPAGPVVIKPAIGAGSKDAARYGPEQAGAAVSHVRRFQGAGMTALVQPYLDRVERDGEVDLVFIGGRYSHSVRKGAMLGPGPRVEGRLFFREEIRSYRATPDERKLAERVLAVVPGGADQLLYARVDLLPSADRGPVVTEVELIEPSLFFGHEPGSAERMAELIVPPAAGT
jgi:glutathione synthase/RimK-type ligase-like ATP-grasp enzyme